MTSGTGVTIGYELPDASLLGSPRKLVDLARAAEAAGVDYLVLPDRPAASTREPGPPAAFVLASWLAAQTSRIGIVVTASTAYHEPYNLARLLASLDHISAGRAGWRAVSGPDASADANHRREGVDPAAERAARAREYVPLIRDLWDSWEDGAFVRDKATGQFVDASRIHTVDHAGPTLRVRGPLNLIRPPQGHPVVFADTTESPVASAADVLIGSEQGARGEQPWVLAVTPIVGESGPEAERLRARPGVPAGDSVIVGDPGQVAEQLVDRRGTATGWSVRFSAAAQVAVFTERVVPRLRSAPSEQSGTLRERLRLPRPENRIAARVPATVAVERS